MSLCGALDCACLLTLLVAGRKKELCQKTRRVLDVILCACQLANMRMGFFMLCDVLCH